MVMEVWGCGSAGLAQIVMPLTCQYSISALPSCCTLLLFAFGFRTSQP